VTAGGSPRADPIVLAHGRALLVTNADTTVVTADLRQPDEVIGNDEVRRLIDFSQPVGVLLIAMTHFLRDEEREPVMSVLRESLVPGNFLAATHVTVDRHSSAAVEGVEASTARRRHPSSSARTPRSPASSTASNWSNRAWSRWTNGGRTTPTTSTRWLYGGVGRRT
jgi:S-adenosyl methyltransferase